MGVQASLADRVADRVASIRHGPRSFFDRLGPEAQAELLEVRRRWQAGELPASASALADLLIEEATASGYEVCGNQGMRAWLARRD
jgi:hypothetical protein